VIAAPDIVVRVVEEFQALWHGLGAVAGTGDGRVIGMWRVYPDNLVARDCRCDFCEFVPQEIAFGTAQWRGSSIGQDNQTASCGVHSGGIENPAEAGVMGGG